MGAGDRRGRPLDGEERVDGVYDKDRAMNPNATRIAIDYLIFVEQPSWDHGDKRRSRTRP